MRGADQQQFGMLSRLSLEEGVPQDHPLRAIRKNVDEILRSTARRRRWSPESRAACSNNFKHMRGSLGDGQARNLVDLVAAQAVPLPESLVDRYGLCISLVAFRVVGVDLLPRRKDQCQPVKRVFGE